MEQNFLFVLHVMCELKMNSAYSSYPGKNAEGVSILTYASSVTLVEINRIC